MPPLAFSHTARRASRFTENNLGTTAALIAKNTGTNPRAAEFWGDVVVFNGCIDACLRDLAEAFAVVGSRNEFEPGDVLTIARDVDDAAEKTNEAYSTLILGVHATAPAMVMGGAIADKEMGEWVPVGIVGVIPTKVSIENGSIRRGDLLVTSSTPGHAMKGTERERMLGAILGKALENFDGSTNPTGIIKVMVNVK